MKTVQEKIQEKALMFEKIDRAKEAQADADFGVLIAILNKWSKKRPDNKELKQMIEAAVSAYTIMQSYHTDRRFYHQSINQYRADKDRAIMRARKSEEKKQEDKKAEGKSLEELTLK
tara:strand:+ start:1166 stop:1516 length:351 start_codon:yes stop_codon:yes gene_type:complete